MKSIKGSSIIYLKPGEIKSLEYASPVIVMCQKSILKYNLDSSSGRPEILLSLEEEVRDLDVLDNGVILVSTSNKLLGCEDIKGGLECEVKGEGRGGSVNVGKDGKVYWGGRVWIFNEEGER